MVTVLIRIPIVERKRCEWICAIIGGTERTLGQIGCKGGEEGGVKVDHFVF